MRYENRTSSRASDTRVPKLVVFLPRPEKGRHALAKSLVNALASHMVVRQGDVKVVIAVPDGLDRQIVGPSAELGTGFEFRDFRWSVVPRAAYLGGYDHASLVPPTLLVPVDNGYGFNDCDLWTFVESFENEWPAATAPYVCFVPELEERSGWDSPRWAPESPFWKRRVQYFHFIRKAKKVFVNEPDRRLELSIYLGVPLNNLIPFKYPYIPQLPTASAYDFRADRYFVWTIDGSTSGDHLFVLKGIEHYYKHLLGCFKTVVLASPNERTHEHHGPGVDFADPYWKAFSDAASSGILAGKVLLVGEPPSLAGYYKILEGATFFLHFKHSGGMSAGLMDAVAAGLPIICSDYPSSRLNIESTTDVSYLDPKLATHCEIAEALARFRITASAAPVRRKVAAKANLEPIAHELVSLINPTHEMASA
jgi:hypothetical protein